MRKLIKTSLFTIGLAAAISSCKKYENGPAISLQSRKARVANTWVIEKATEKGDDVTSSYDQYTLTLAKDGDATLKAVYALGDFTFDVETDGTWNFKSDDEELALDFENNMADNTYQILKLKDKEMWLREKGGDIELQLKSK